MRVYQLKHYEVLLNDQQSMEPALLGLYEQLCRRILTAEAIARNNLVEIARFNSFPKIIRKPVKLERMLNQQSLAPFHFIISRN